MKKLFSVTQFILKNVLSVNSWKNLRGNIIWITKSTYHVIVEFLSFFLLLVSFIIEKTISTGSHVPILKLVIIKIQTLWQKSFHHVWEKFARKLDTAAGSTVKRSYVISLSYNNLAAKKSRTMITVLGMSVGVGIIVLLLSLGYGIERLIISRVTSLDELKIIDVSTGANTTLRLNKDAFNKIKKMSDVVEVMPLVSFVGKVDYQNAKTDVLAYATTHSYIESLNVKLIQGKLFKSNYAILRDDTEVAGIGTRRIEGTFGQPVSSDSVHFSIIPDAKVYAYAACSSKSDIAGTVQQLEGGFDGREYWGDVYVGKGREEGYDSSLKKPVQTWVQASMPMFYEIADGSLLPELGDNGRQVWKTVCLQKADLRIDSTRPILDTVLGDATESATLASTGSDASGSALLSDLGSSEGASLFGGIVVSTDSAGIEVIEFNDSAKVKTTAQTVIFKTKKAREAIVSSAFLSLLNIPLEKALQTTFTVSYVLTKSIVPTLEGKVTSELADYTIVGVLDDTDSPYYYVPLDDAVDLQIKNYSQLKVVMAKQESLPTVRKQIDVLGFRTSSTADTVSQIEDLFGNLRLLLALVGLVALGVAALGMFNTLTVSLLERTREIGGMKTIGMVSKEVRDLFLAEAMIMGFAGGIGGLFFGFLAGKIISLIVSFVAFANGEGYLELTYIPVFLVIDIIVASFVIGVLTGLYPAHRARKISALNALRYE